MTLPPAPATYSAGNENQTRGMIAAAFSQSIKNGQVQRLLLKAPNGTVYEGTISNAGVLAWTALP